MQTLDLAYYSPTGTTQKIIREIGRNIGWRINNEINLSFSKQGDSLSCIGNGNLTIIGMPVYAGRIPANTVERLKSIKSKHTPVVLIVVYGNRAFDDSLLELKHIATECGFDVIAAAAFIGEHSFSTNEFPVAVGRPDRLDLEKAADFSKEILKKLNEHATSNRSVDLQVHGNFPYRNGVSQPEPISPETDSTKCDTCGVCVEVCPTDAISVNNGVTTKKELCTWCCACIKICPNEARIFKSDLIKGFSQKLNTNCSSRKEPEFFL